MNKRFLPVFAVIALAIPCAVLACRNAENADAPKPAVSAQVSEATHQKLGMNTNYLPEVAGVVVETGVVEWPKAAADPSATTTTGETAVGVMGAGPVSIPIASCSYHPAANLTASNTAYASITVYKRTNGGAAVMIAQTTTAITAADAGTDAATGSWTAWTPVTIPAAPGAYLAAGDVVTVAIAKTGSGVVVPQGELVCYTTLN